MSDEEPIRLSVESSSSSLRRALTAAKEELPSSDHVEQMLARFPFPPPGPSGDGGADGGGGGTIGHVEPIAAAAKSGLGLKILAGVLVTGAVGAGVFVATRPATTLVESSSAPVATSLSVIVASAPETVPAEVTFSATTIASSALAAVSVPRRPTTASATTSASAPAARPEMEILKEAQAARRSNPARALQLVDEHAAAYPRSGMAQEREMIRIESLLGVGRRAEAKTLADAFRKANPNSGYSRRLDALLGE